MGWALDYWWQITLIVIGAALLISNILLFIGLRKIQREVEWTNVTNTPRDGFPEHMEASWEDIGARGRYLTDLGGMSIKMREQMYDEFRKALNKPNIGISAAGSIIDVMADLDAWLTKQAKDEDVST